MSVGGENESDAYLRVLAREIVRLERLMAQQMQDHEHSQHSMHRHWHRGAYFDDAEWARIRTRYYRRHMTHGVPLSSLPYLHQIEPDYFAGKSDEDVTAELDGYDPAAGC